MLAEPICFTLIYGNPNSQFRYHFWNLLRILAAMTSLSWCFFGYLDEILCLDESTSTNHRCSSAIQDFQKSITDCDLHDLGFSGPQFTYSNRSKDLAEVKVRLDHFL